MVVQLLLLFFLLAFPLIAGPGSLTTLLSLRAEFHIENIIAAVLLNVYYLCCAT